MPRLAFLREFAKGALDRFFGTGTILDHLCSGSPLAKDTSCQCPTFGKSDVWKSRQLAPDIMTKTLSIVATFWAVFPRRASCVAPRNMRGTSAVPVSAWFQTGNAKGMHGPDRTGHNAKGHVRTLCPILVATFCTNLS